MLCWILSGPCGYFKTAEPESWMQNQERRAEKENYLLPSRLLPLAGGKSVKKKSLYHLYAAEHLVPGKLFLRGFQEELAMHCDRRAKRTHIW